MSTCAGASFPLEGDCASSGATHAKTGAEFACDVSIVIPTCRRPDMLARCLRALVAQRYDACRFEIVVCDDGPDDVTRERVTAFARESETAMPPGPRVRYMPVTATQGPAGARNAGWRTSAASFIAFTDDDTIADTDWLAAGVAALAAGADVVAGRIVVPLSDHPTDYERDAAGLAHAEFATANAFFTRSALERAGGFDARFTSAWREDSDIQFELLRIRAHVVPSREAMVLHPVRPARWGVSLSQQKKSQFDALLFKKHRTLYRARIRRTPPLLYYAILACIALALISFGYGHGTIAYAFLVAWLALTGGFCKRRLLHTALTPSHVLEMAWTSLWIPFLSIFWRLYGAVKFRVVFV
ncbi:MAG TPA: glycosyltransferase [Trinickia sp.]|uniref:glycosyltransferase n=1 Tax=Trinickia sp. TaxID=2571163 RepID=UPI002BAD86F7|nr:glycosyltransferase [Trinickia sp.]HTI16608.1 glycosyltransferase [Trinickia sp.]